MSRPTAETSIRSVSPGYQLTNSRHGKYFQNNNMNAETSLNHHQTEESDNDEFWPLSGKPYFDFVLAKSHVKSYSQLFLPSKIAQILPPENVPAILNYRGRSWEMIYVGQNIRKRFDKGWFKFVVDNHLKVGDACVFELMDLSSARDKLKFRVQILRGDFPPELIAKLDGETSNAPIVID